MSGIDLKIEAARELLRDCPGISMEGFVRGIIERHEGEGCRFEPGAVAEILAELPADARYEDAYPLINKREVVCVHEGIDRRAELGMV